MAETDTSRRFETRAGVTCVLVAVAALLAVPSLAAAAPGDADDDGIPDGVEEQVDGLDSTNADTDGDGVPDGDEDTDGDGLVNLAELEAGTALSIGDTDWDGASDGDEVDAGTDPLDPDTDDDGASDGAEFRAGSDPLDPGSTPETVAATRQPAVAPSTTTTSTSTTTTPTTTTTSTTTSAPSTTAAASDDETTRAGVPASTGARMGTSRADDVTFVVVSESTPNPIAVAFTGILAAGLVVVVRTNPARNERTPSTDLVLAGDT